MMRTLLLPKCGCCCYTVALLLVSIHLVPVSNAFAPAPLVVHPPTRLFQSTKTETSQATTASTTTTTTTSPPPPNTNQQKTLGLLTFDLDDTLYPIAPVLDQANAAFCRAMENFGYSNLQPDDILNAAKRIRQEHPDGAILSHTQVRLLAIRQEMEKVILEQKLKDTAEDWATDVEALSKVVVQSAKKWSKAAVPESVVQAVYTAWEMERYHAAERLLYPEVVDVLDQIKSQYPEVIVGAVTDGRANPKLMTFTLAPYFDFCVSWEDDQGSRSQFFTDLGSVSGNADLTWIYNAAREQYKVLSESAAQLKKLPAEASSNDNNNIVQREPVWIHVGDDLAYDVGGSAACGAKTILVELADSYGQTARKRFDPNEPMPAWSTSPPEELENHQVMNEAAAPFVDERIDRLTKLPEAIQRILEKEEEE